MLLLEPPKALRTRRRDRVANYTPRYKGIKFFCYICHKRLNKTRNIVKYFTDDRLEISSMNVLSDVRSGATTTNPWSLRLAFSGVKASGLG